jgi:hypothetical protein
MPIAMPQTRAILPDAVTDDAVVLFKAGQGTLRLTYEIRMTVYLARKLGKRPLLVMPKGAELAPSLQTFVVDHGIEIRRLDG